LYSWQLDIVVVEAVAVVAAGVEVISMTTVKPSTVAVALAVA
jgi:hypothetical protein